MKKQTLDGNTACALGAYMLNEASIIYPITPSSPMAETCDAMASRNEKNAYGGVMSVVEMQSEAGAAGALHGALSTGTLSTTFTASQGLLLMIPNMYKIAGELLPCVIHVSARTLATHALSIFGDHSDVMACRQTGFAMLCANSVQEAHDFAIVSQIVSLKTRVPFLHFFDGFRTSHEIGKIDTLELSDVMPLIPFKAIDEFKKRALNPEHPHQQGTAQNPDVFFQNREACNKYYNSVYKVLQESFSAFGKISGRKYSAFEYYGAKDAENVIVAMGSACETIEETLAYLNKSDEQNCKAGLLKVRLYRPFDVEAFIKTLPENVKTITVLDRTKEPGSVGEPLYTDVCTSLIESGKTAIKVLGGRYGLSSKEFTPDMVKAVIENMNSARKNHFTVGINDDVTHTSLTVSDFHLPNKGNTNCMFYGLGSDGTVSANKNSIKIIGDYTEKYAQGYFVYDSKKSGSITISHLRFGPKPIKSTYEIQQADFMACHNSRYIGKYDMLSRLAEGGTFLLNCPWSEKELETQLPASFKRSLALKKAQFYIIDANRIARELGLGGKINTIMQSAFFKLANILEFSKAKELMGQMAKKSYAKAGEAVIEQNLNAINAAESNLTKIDIPSLWLSAESRLETSVTEDATPFFCKIMKPVQRLEGNKIPVSQFSPDGRIETDTTRFEKRGIASIIPEWKHENCIQCNFCSYVCPHAAIRPYLVDKKTKGKNLGVTIPAQNESEYEFRVQVSPLDCTGCGSCVNVCPTRNKALVLNDSVDLFKQEVDNYEFYKHITNPEKEIKTVKDSQFASPYFEFNGACAGCGETPYIKLATQLFGDRMIIANATGCTSIYGGSYPSCPYSRNKDGKGPAWANSLFEDNAEFGFGMRVALDARSTQLFNKIDRLIALKPKSEKELRVFKETFKNSSLNKLNAVKLEQALKLEGNTATGEVKKLIDEVLSDKDLFINKSVWIIGGDGWAYDIGYGGLDHVLSRNENVNILVLDTEVYSNTGGQASKATPTGSVAKFAASGKRTAKKSLALMAMNYPNTYVAQIAMGANMNQTLQAFQEAEAHDGPSIIIAYATCIEHGIDMSNGMLEMRKAVQCGYFNLFRHNPKKREDGKPALTLDSPVITGDYKEFAKSERRYANLYKIDPVLADNLIEQAKQESEILFDKLKKLSEAK